MDDELKSIFEEHQKYREENSLKLRYEAYNNVKKYIILGALIDELEKDYDHKELAWFLLSNKFYEIIEFYNVDDFCNVEKLGDKGKELVKNYLLNSYDCSKMPRSDLENNFKKYNLEFRYFCVHIDELKALPFLQGKIDYDELVTEFEIDEEITPLETIHDFKLQLCREQGKNYRLTQENRQLHAKIAELNAQLANNGQQGGAISEADTTPRDLKLKGHLLTIGILLDIIQNTPQGTDKDCKPLPPKYPSLNAIYDKFAEYDIKTQSQKTLEGRFAGANREFKQAKRNK